MKIKKRHLITLHIVAALFSCKLGDKENNKTKTLSSLTTFEYSPSKCPFKVKFSGKPTIKETLFLVNGERIKSETAEFLVGNCFQRTELCTIDQNQSSAYDKELLFKILTEFSKSNGLSYPEFNYLENEFGKSATLRGYKTISERRVIYFANAYVKETSLFIMSVACPADEFPTDEIDFFLNSLSLKT